MTTPGLIMLGVMTAVWLAGCAVVCWMSPKARERMPTLQLLARLLLAGAPWVVLIPSTNLLMAASGIMFGSAFVLGGLLLVGVIALDLLTRNIRSLLTAYGLPVAQTGGAQ